MTARVVKARATNSTAAFQVAAADYVTTEDGTGIVHIAPAYGEESLRYALATMLVAPLVASLMLWVARGKIAATADAV